MDPRLQEMLDHYEITKTLAEYAHGCDRCDEPRMASVYHADSWDDHGMFKAGGKQFAREMCAHILETYECMYHLHGQSIITVTGDEAGAETYFFAAALAKGEDGKMICSQLGGRFVDRLVREDGVWLIKHRMVMRDWTIALPVEQDWEPARTLTWGKHSNEDPAFAALGRVHGGLAAVPA